MFNELTSSAGLKLNRLSTLLRKFDNIERELGKAHPENIERYTLERNALGMLIDKLTRELE